MVDLNTFTSLVQANTIISILVGSGYSYQEIPHIDITTGEKRNIQISEFMNLILSDVLIKLSSSPTASFAPEMEWFAADKRFAENCRALRGYYAGIINDKKAANDPNAQDIVSILLQDENYQDTEDIIDDIFVMFLAGSKTVQTTTSNLITSLLFNTKVHEKFLKEVDPLMDRVKDDILNKMSHEDVEELDYVKMCYQESMRIAAPAEGSSTSCFNKPVTIDGIQFDAGDAFFVMMKYIQMDPKQWIEPNSFIPERFDTESPYYKTPDGGKRNPFAFCPFLGGSRVCLGKTFAEITLKFVLPIWYHAFTFELVKEEHK